MERSVTEISETEFFNPFRDGRHSMPWSDDEFITVDGKKLVYTMRASGEMLVRFPGRITVSLADLQSEGRSIVMPLVVRHNDYA